MPTFNARPKTHHGNQRGQVVTITRPRETYVVLPRALNANPIIQGSNGETLVSDDTSGAVFAYYDESLYDESYYGS